MRKHLLILFAACIAAIYSFAQTPTITSFSPASGPVGTLVTITGTNLGSPTTFTIGGVAAIVVSDNGSALVGMVMPGAVTGGVSVTTTGGSVSGNGNFTIIPTPHPSVQQGNKLIGSVGLRANQGSAVAISADGNTAIVGGYFDSSSVSGVPVGAAWIYTRSGGIWTQQGSKLVGSGYIGGSNQGCAVALSADGNTAIVGGYYDNSGIGAVWIWVRTGNTWAQQGPKLVGTGAIGAPFEGYSVSLSADGNTAIAGGYADNYNAGSGTYSGAAWIYTRSGTSWAQQGPKLVGIDTVGGSEMGRSVALSADGKTAIIGGYADSVYTGAAWVYTRTGNTWTQQGHKLVGTGASGTTGSYQGSAVALSADGNTALVGGFIDSNGLSYGVAVGATWVYTRSGGIWTQQGSKLVGAGGIGDTEQGWAVSLSADGNTAIIGGLNDNNSAGAVWIFTRSGSTWSQRGNKLVGSGANNTLVGATQGWSVAISADGKTAIEGGGNDNDGVGAAWIFIDSVAPCSPVSSSISHAICQGDTFFFGNRYVTSAGTYNDTITTAGGCDSIVTLILYVNQPDVVSLDWSALLQAGDLFRPTADDTAWCSGYKPSVFPMLGGSPPGGTYTGNNILNDTFHFDIFHYYGRWDTVYYTYTNASGCTAIAVDSISMEICEGINNISDASLIHLYPNPNKGSFTLQTSNNINSAYTISDMLGNVIAQQNITANTQTIDMKDAAEGVYTLTVKGAAPVRFVIVR